MAELLEQRIARFKDTLSELTVGTPIEVLLGNQEMPGYLKTGRIGYFTKLEEEVLTIARDKIYFNDAQTPSVGGDETQTFELRNILDIKTYKLESSPYQPLDNSQNRIIRNF